jgi:hypothetical protein
MWSGLPETDNTLERAHRLREDLDPAAFTALRSGLCSQLSALATGSTI